MHFKKPDEASVTKIVLRMNALNSLVAWVRKLLAEVEESGRTVHWVHVKGHSPDGGNDKADERVQWGKEAGPMLGCGRGAAMERAATALPRGWRCQAMSHRRCRWWTGGGGLALPTRRSKCSRTWLVAL